jgi:hypothetical protein
LLAGVAAVGSGRSLAQPAPLLARQAAPPKPLSREEELRAANERRLASAKAIATLELPMATEPAFVFHS